MKYYTLSLFISGKQTSGNVLFLEENLEVNNILVMCHIAKMVKEVNRFLSNNLNELYIVIYIL